MTITRQQLDQMECSAPGCKHRDHTEVYYLKGACHPRAHCQVSYNEDEATIAIRCANCATPIVDVACEGRYEATMFRASTCHPYAGLLASYDKSTGRVTIGCGSCEQPVVHVVVAAP